MNFADPARMITPRESHDVETENPSREPMALVGIKSAVALSLREESPNGVALATADGAVRYLNRVAETMTAMEDGLALRDGLLVAARAAEQGRFLKALARAALATSRIERRSRSALIVRRPSRR